MPKILLVHTLPNHKPTIQHISLDKIHHFHARRKIRQLNRTKKSSIYTFNRTPIIGAYREVNDSLPIIIYIRAHRYDISRMITISTTGNSRATAHAQLEWAQHNFRIKAHKMILDIIMQVRLNKSY